MECILEVPNVLTVGTSAEWPSNGVLVGWIILSKLIQQDEERWFTLGSSSEGKLLAVSYTFHQPADADQAKVRIISAREATRRERQQYEDEPR